jgi:CRP-like cAMP-binding protein
MLDLLAGDQFLLASDGLHGYINHTAELEPYFEDEDGEKAATELIELANRKGGKDNITCILVRIGAAGQKDDVGARRLAQKREALAGMPLFSKLQERELLRIMQVAEVLEFKPGEEVVREGDRGDELFIVVDGLLNIVRGEQILSEVGPGEHFGEMALIRSSPRSASVRAVEPSELISIRRNDFFAILRKEYELAVKLLWQFLGVLADRLDQTSRDLSSAKEELAAEDITDAISEDEEAFLASEEARLSALPSGSKSSSSRAPPSSDGDPLDGNGRSSSEGNPTASGSRSRSGRPSSSRPAADGETPKSTPPVSPAKGPALGGATLPSAVTLPPPKTGELGDT